MVGMDWRRAHAGQKRVHMHVHGACAHAFLPFFRRGVEKIRSDLVTFISRPFLMCTRFQKILLMKTNEDFVHPKYRRRPHYALRTT